MINWDDNLPGGLVFNNTEINIVGRKLVISGDKRDVGLVYNVSWEGQEEKNISLYSEDGEWRVLTRPDLPISWKGTRAELTAQWRVEKDQLTTSDGRFLGFSVHCTLNGKKYVEGLGASKELSEQWINICHKLIADIEQDPWKQIIEVVGKLSRESVVGWEGSQEAVRRTDEAKKGNRLSKEALGLLLVAANERPDIKAMVPRFWGMVQDKKSMKI